LDQVDNSKRMRNKVCGVVVNTEDMTLLEKIEIILM